MGTVRFKIVSYALPKLLLTLHENGVYEFFITQEDGELVVSIERKLLLQIVYPNAFKEKDIPQQCCGEWEKD